jgi:hypothetical protein
MILAAEVRCEHVVAMRPGGAIALRRRTAAA